MLKHQARRAVPWVDSAPAQLPEPPDLPPEIVEAWEARRRHIEAFLLGVRAKQNPRPRCYRYGTPEAPVACEVADCDGCHPYIDWTPHARQAEAFYADVPKQFITAATRVGKSSYGSVRVVFAATGVPPLWFVREERAALFPLLPHPRPEATCPWRVWMVSPKAENLDREVVREYVLPFLQDTGWLEGYDEQPGSAGRKYVKEIRCLGGTITVKIQDQNIDAFKSAKVDHIHIDEEPHGELGERIIRECLSRTTDRRGRVVAPFTAVDSAGRSGESWVAQSILDPGLNGTGGGLDPADFYVRNWTIYDNTYLSREAREQHVRNYCDPITLEPADGFNLYVLGLVSGENETPALPSSSIRWQRDNVARVPTMRGEIVDGDGSSWAVAAGFAHAALLSEQPVSVRVRFAESPNGRLSVWESPQVGGEYTIGADAGLGVAMGNPCAAWVLDRHTGRFVACWHGSVDPLYFGEQLIRLGHWYNRAWLCVEDAGPGWATVSHLAGGDCGHPRYERLYLHQSAGKYQNVDAMRPGYPATAESRQFALDALVWALTPTTPGDPETMPVRIPCEDTLREMRAVRIDAHQRIVKGTLRQGAMTLHGDRYDAACLAIVAHRTPWCQMSSRAPARKVHESHLVELLSRQQERERQDARYRAGGEVATLPGIEGLDWTEEPAGAWERGEAGW